MKYVPEDLTDPELLELLNRGEQDAMVCIYKRYWSELYRCAFKLFPNQETCEDLIHDVFCFLWNKRETLRVESLKDYLYIAVRNRALNKLRSEKRYLKVETSQSEQRSADSQTDDGIHYEEINIIFDQTLTRLPERCRKIMIMSRKEHLSAKEIASQLNISPKTVENQITIGLRQLRIMLNDFLASCIVLFSFFEKF